MYATFYNFGKNVNGNVEKDWNSVNPLSYCMFPTVNSQFIHGSTAGNLLYTPQCQNCQNFMAERCAKDYDGYCRAYKTINTDTYWPNLASIDSKSQTFANNILGRTSTVGENMLRNACERRFLQFPIQPTLQPFDPNVANSPWIKIYGTYTLHAARLQNLDNAEKVNKDELVQEMIENPKVCFDILGRIYQGWIQHDPALHIQNTKLEKYLQENGHVFEQYLRQAVHNVPSLQSWKPNIDCHR